MASIGICIAENKIMKPIILFASAICLALLGVVAAYLPDLKGQMILLGMMASLVWALVFGYVPKLRKWCALFCGIVILPGSFAAVIYSVYTDGILSLLSGGGGGAFGALVAWNAHRKGRVAMKKSGLPIEPGDENKSDEELEAEDKAEGFGKHRNLHRGK